MAEAGVPNKDRDTTSNTGPSGAGWPIDSKERNDFYHRIRTFPHDVGRWREGYLDRVLSQRLMFPAGAGSKNRSQIRSLIDEGISQLREISRILMLSYSADRPGGNPSPSSQSPERLMDISRVLARIGPYREL